MHSTNLLHGVIAFAAAFLAGAINSVAGGGTLVSFPTLIWLGLPSVTANATSTVAIWPGTLGGIFGYRRELRSASRRILILVIPCLIGGIAGAFLLRYTPPALFDTLVPYLILAATLLFMIQEPVQRKLRTSPGAAHESAAWLVGAGLFQLLVGIYGGYFGAGIGILTLASLGILGLKDIHQMNGVKNFFGMAINGVAAIYFIFAHMVYWPDVIVMVAGSILGGVAGAGTARRMGAKAVRFIVIAIGLGIAVSLFLKH